MQAIFDQVPGIVKTEVGYTGGHSVNPDYRSVCTGTTGHAEATKVEFDSNKVSYNELLEIFWMNHDPTTMNQQGPDFGEQYRSAIFYINEQQKKLAEKSKENQQKKSKKKIVTEITKASEFYPAEDYHQKYYKSHAISCHVRLPGAKK